MGQKKQNTECRNILFYFGRYKKLSKKIFYIEIKISGFWSSERRMGLDGHPQFAQSLSDCDHQRRTFGIISKQKKSIHKAELFNLKIQFVYHLK